MFVVVVLYILFRVGKHFERPSQTRYPTPTSPVPTPTFPVPTPTSPVPNQPYEVSEYFSKRERMGVRVGDTFHAGFWYCTVCSVV